MSKIKQQLKGEWWNNTNSLT